MERIITMKILKKIVNPTAFLLFSILCLCGALTFHHEQTKPQSEYQLAVAKGLNAPSGMTRPNKNGAYYVFISSPSPKFYADATSALIYWEDKTNIPFLTTKNHKKANIEIIDTHEHLSKTNKKRISIGYTITHTKSIQKCAIIKISPKAEAETYATTKMTTIHEIGHALGLDHVQDKKSIMYPVLNPSQKLTKANIKRARANHRAIYPNN